MSDHGLVDASDGTVMVTDLALRACENVGWALRAAGMDVRFVRGQRCRIEEALFAEWAAACQFPYYFGENWPAFDECLRDLEWLGQERPVVIVVTRGDEVLADSPASMPAMAGVLGRLAEHEEESPRLFVIAQVTGGPVPGWLSAPVRVVPVDLAALDPEASGR